MSRSRESNRAEVHPIIRQIIDRDCHVSLSNGQVVEHVISLLRNGYDTYRSMSALNRRRFVRQCIQRHRENRKLYVEVMFPSYSNESEESNGS